MLIVRSLYGLNSFVEACKSMLAQTLKDLGYESLLANYDAWIIPTIRSNGDKYYSYALIHVDDILQIHHDTKQFVYQIHDTYRLKEVIGDLDVYLWYNIKK